MATGMMAHSPTGEGGGRGRGAQGARAPPPESREAHSALVVARAIISQACRAAIDDRRAPPRPCEPWRRPSAQAAGAGLSAQARGLRLEEGDEGDLADLLMQRMLDPPKAVAKAPPAPAVTHS